MTYLDFNENNSIQRTTETLQIISLLLSSALSCSMDGAQKGIVAIEFCLEDDYLGSRDSTDSNGMTSSGLDTISEMEDSHGICSLIESEDFYK